MMATSIRESCKSLSQSCPVEWQLGLLVHVTPTPLRAANEPRAPNGSPEFVIALFIRLAHWPRGQQ